MRVDAVQTIKDRLTMREVLLHYGYEPNKAGFVCCAFHHEKTASMKVYEKSYHCFGCGENGDVISFVKELFGLSFYDTLKKIDLDFNLNIYGEHTFEELRRSHYQQKKIQSERERRKREIEQAKNDYFSNMNKYLRLEKNKRIYAPLTPEEEWHPLFIEALQKLAYQQYLLDMAEVRWFEVERASNTVDAGK